MCRKDPLRPLSKPFWFVCLLAAVFVTVAETRVAAQWEKVTLPAAFDNDYFLDIMFLPGDTNYGWACSQAGAVIRSVDGGATWTGIRLTSSAFQQPSPFLESVMFLSRFVGYVSGPGGIFRTVDGGQTFREVTPNQMDLNTEQGWGCFFLNELEGMYFVDGCGGLQKFFRTTDGGLTWTRYVTQELQSGLSDGIIYPDGHGFASSSGLIWETTNRGQSWHVFAQTGPRYWTEEMTNINSTFLLPTAGSDCSGKFGDVGSLRWTSNNGSTWREFQTKNAMFGSFLIDENHGWGVGINRTVLYTADAGRNWEMRNCGIQGDPDDIFFTDANHGWVTGFGVYRSIFDRQPKLVSLDPPDNVIRFCEGESVTIGGTTGLTNYLWEDGTNTPSRTLTSAGTYILHATDPVTCFTSADTVRVVVYPETTPQIQSSKSAVCFGDSVVLRAPGPYRTWSWSDGSTADSITVSKSGTYLVTTVDTNGCTRVSAAFNVDIRPPVEPQITNSRPLTFCIDDSVTLFAPSGYVQYLWSSGEVTPSIVVKTAGTYTVSVVDDAGCEGTSPAVTVTVLNIRNQIEVQMMQGGAEVIVPNHIVGQQRCADITIRNRSDSTVLSITNPHLLGNVFCSLPLSQLPITLGPLGTLTLSICCSAIDTGIVYDTLELPDTCSSSFIPVRSYGLPNTLDGIARCNIPVGTLIYRAGSPYQLSNPFPVPTRDRIRTQVRMPETAQNGVVSAMVVNTLGQTVARAWTVTSTVGTERVTDVEADVQSLDPGLYSIAIVLGDGSILRHQPFIRDSR